MGVDSQDSEDYDRVVGSFSGPSASFVAPYRGDYGLEAALMLDDVAVIKAQKDFTVSGAPRLKVALAPLDPAPGGTVAAEARFDSPPSAAGPIAYEWSCDVCSVATLAGAKAALRRRTRARRPSRWKRERAQSARCSPRVARCSGSSRPKRRGEQAHFSVDA